MEGLKRNTFITSPNQRQNASINQYISKSLAFQLDVLTRTKFPNSANPAFVGLHKNERFIYEIRSPPNEPFPWISTEVRVSLTVFYIQRRFPKFESNGPEKTPFAKFSANEEKRPPVFPKKSLYDLYRSEQRGRNCCRRAYFQIKLRPKRNQITPAKQRCINHILLDFVERFCGYIFFDPLDIKLECVLD